MPSNVARSLGLPSDARIVVLHANNGGMCHATNLGFFEVLEAGVVTSGSVLVPGPWFPEVADYLSVRPQLEVGVSLCLNSPFPAYRWRPVCGADGVPSLVDRTGCFHAAVSDTLDTAEPEEAFVEMRAQVELAIDVGIDVTHLDVYLGTPLMKQLLPAYLEVARDFRLPVFLPRPTKALLAEMGMSGSRKNIVSTLSALGVDDNVLVDHVELRSLCFAPEQVEEHFRRILREIRPGVTHLLINPAAALEELEAITPDSWLQRDAERDLFGDAGAREMFEEEGIVLVGYRRLREIVRASDKRRGPVGIRMNAEMIRRYPLDRRERVSWVWTQDQKGARRAPGTG